MGRMAGAQAARVRAVVWLASLDSLGKLAAQVPHKVVAPHQAPRKGVFLMTVVLILYCVAAFLLFIYGMNCYVLVLNFRRHRRSALARLERVREEYRRVPEADLPTVTVQLPVYNERYVVGRVIQAVCHLQWLREKLEIRIRGT